MVLFICRDCGTEGYETQPEVVTLYCRKCKSKNVEERE